jgi:hypothetical protein
MRIKINSSKIEHKVGEIYKDGNDYYMCVQFNDKYFGFIEVETGINVGVRFTSLKELDDENKTDIHINCCLTSN